MTDYEHRVRERAYKLWLEEGRPEGRADVHWEQALELVAIEDNFDLALKLLPKKNDIGLYGEPVEPLQPAENAGDTPTMVDQGERETIPHRRIDYFIDEK